MNDNDELLEEIRLQEKSKILFKGKLTNTFIISTEKETLSEMYKVAPDTNEKTFRPSPLNTVLLFLIIGFIIVALFPLRALASKHTWTYLHIAIMLGLLVFIIREGFFNPKKNYTIRLNFEGINLNNQFYKWTEIKASGILRIGLGRAERNYLVLAFNNGSYEKYNLIFFLTFWGFKSALSSYIEYFKTMQQNFKNKST